jgi:Ti-type conjugative transfer relaxase TraA
MLSVGKLAAGPQAGRYYEDAVARGREDYYAGEGERPGRWVGGGAAELGLTGQVEDEQTGRLLAGEHPASGDLLGRPMEDGSVAGFDLTFSAPKSVGLAFAIGDRWTTRVLRDCHERAVDDALGYLERVACRARRGKGGALVVEGKGFAAAAFDHRTSRAGDPLLHTHVVVANRTLGNDGRWTALDARPLYRELKTAGYLYQARLRHEVSERLGAHWGPVRKGAADLRGFSPELIDHFSRRRAEIREAMALHDSHGLAANNAATLATRKAKDYEVPMERLREEWRARAAEHGLTQERVEYLLTPRFRDRVEPGRVELDALTRHHSTFTRRDVLQAVCEVHPDGAASVADLEARADEVLRSREVVRIPDPAGTRYTTRDQLALERSLLDGAKQRRDRDTAVAADSHVDAALASRSLSAEQKAAVRALTGSGHGVEVLRAPAGAGKTFALDAAREAWERSGQQVVGCALSAHAARELREQAGVQGETIASLKQRLNHGYRLPENGVLIVDEAGMVGTRDLAELEVHTLQSKTKLLLVGDDRQLPEIEAGGAFRAIADRSDPVELKEVRRQDRDWDRDALSALRDGRTADWADAYVEHARVKTAATAPEVREQLASDWWQAKQTGADARMIALRRSDVADLNERARERMRDAGRLDGPDRDFAGKPFATGDEIVVTKNNRSLEVINGDRGAITDAQPGHLDIQLDSGKEVRLPGTFVADGHLDHGYATTAHKAQGSTMDRAFVLGSQESYREWGYTALSRHRDASTYYLAEPKPFINRDPELTRDPEQLKLQAERSIADSREHELAIDLADKYGAHRNEPTERDGPTDEQRQAAREIARGRELDLDYHPTEEQRDAAKRAVEKHRDLERDLKLPELPDFNQPEPTREDLDAMREILERKPPPPPPPRIEPPDLDIDFMDFGP